MKFLHPACKNRVVGCWRGYLPGARCRLAYGPADVTATHFSKIQIGFSFLVPAHLGSPGKRAVKRVCDHEVFITQAPINNLTVMPFGTLV